jgi:biotin synthase
MGPYIPHDETPIYLQKPEYPSPTDRFELSQRMIALLRILMKDINIAAATALDVLYPSGRAIALISGANVFMPNLTPEENAKNYRLYHDKPVAADQADCSVVEMTEKIRPYNLKIVYEDWGDSPHYGRRIMNN